MLLAKIAAMPPARVLVIFHVQGIVAEVTITEAVVRAQIAVGGARIHVKRGVEIPVREVVKVVAKQHALEIVKPAAKSRVIRGVKEHVRVCVVVVAIVAWERVRERA